MLKNVFKALILTVCLLANVAANAAVYFVTAEPKIYGTDPMNAHVVKIMRPTGTQDAFITYSDGTSSTLTGGWSIFSGNPKVWHSYDGAQYVGTTAVAGLDEGYDAVAVIKNNILYQVGNAETKEATYYFLGGSSVTLKHTTYLDWIFWRTTP